MAEYISSQKSSSQLELFQLELFKSKSSHLAEISRSPIQSMKLLSDTSAELLMINKLSESEYQDFMAKWISEKKNKIESGWYQVSIESIFDINLNK